MDGRSSTLAVVEHRRLPQRPRPGNRRSRPTSASLGGTAAWRSEQATEAHARRQALARKARAMKQEEEAAAMGERIVSPTPESASPLSHQASAGKSERSAAGEEKRRRGKGRRKFPARFQQASREMGVLPFMGAVPVSRNPASRELWDNPEFPPDHQAVPASDKPEAPVHPAHVLPMNHQGQFTLASSSSGRGKKSEMDMPHNGVMPPASPSRLDDSIATASSGWFLTPDSSPAAR